MWRFLNLDKKSAVSIQLTLMVQVPLKCTVTKQQPVVDGLCSRRDRMARLISTATGLTIRVALVT